jgi:hypothetical protein
MKRVLLSMLVLSGFLFPLLAQVDHDYNPNDLIPLVNNPITKDQVPAEVVKTVSTKFDKINPNTFIWYTFPFALKEYAFVYDAGASYLKLNRYLITTKTGSGNDLWAVVSDNGNLIETREMSQSIPIPPSVQESLSKSQYKDWTIAGNKEIIRYYHENNESSVEQHFRITVEKDKVSRSISFNYQPMAYKK